MALQNGACPGKNIFIFCLSSIQSSFMDILTHQNALFVLNKRKTWQTISAVFNVYMSHVRSPLSMQCTLLPPASSLPSV